MGNFVIHNATSRRRVPSLENSFAASLVVTYFLCVMQDMFSITSTLNMITDGMCISVHLSSHVTEPSFYISVSKLSGARVTCHRRRYDKIMC